ncbi:SHOCT domain-containing protein [Clostridium arbusti]|uniref:SHOCT domain-containing protein n=1 Tax=Clostridium arbusti TaxID=1137848 RepID=UPI000288C83D|nr:SHOCT domain-containing protein [Clostridium arbusti]
MMYYGFGYGGMFMMLVPIILIAIIVYAIIKLKDHPSHGDNNNRALDILNERYARGEINEEEYKQKKNTIMRR